MYEIIKCVFNSSLSFSLKSNVLNLNVAHGFPTGPVADVRDTWSRYDEQCRYNRLRL